MRIGIIGAGAIGSVVGGMLTKAGRDVTLIDQWPEHVASMRGHGLRLSGTCGEHLIPVKAIHLHELLMYLGDKGVASLLIGAHQGLVGTNMQTPVDASYLADAVILLRYYEAEGEVRQAISVMKKRGGHHERTIREFALTAQGIRIGEPLRQLRGVLTGVPVFNSGTPYGEKDK